MKKKSNFEKKVKFRKSQILKKNENKLFSNKFFFFSKKKSYFLFLMKKVKFPQNLSASMEGRPGPCCYDFKWSEITARGDWSSEPLLFWFQMKWNDSKGRTNVGGICLNDNPLRWKHSTTPSSRCLWNII